MTADMEADRSDHRLDAQYSEQLSSAVAKSTVTQIALQFGSKIVSLVLNSLFLLRYLDRTSLGIANVRLALLYSTILSVSREPFRRSVPSMTELNRLGWQRFVNFCYLVIPVSATVNILLTLVWLLSSGHLLRDEDASSHFATCLAIYSIAAQIELSVEPVLLMFSAQLKLSQRMAIEGIASCLNTVGVCMMIGSRVLREQYPLLVLSTGQLIQAVMTSAGVYFLGYRYSRTSKSPLSLPSRTVNLPSSLMSKSLSFFKHNITKQLIGQAEAYAMTFFYVIPDLADQAIYDAIAKLGSMVARLLLAPIEENAYILYSRQSHTPGDNSAAMYMTTTLRFLTSLALCGMCIVVPYVNVFTWIYGVDGKLANDLLRIYTVYTIVMAWNGLTEAYLQATASAQQLSRHRKFLLICSLSASVPFLLLRERVGAVSLLLGSCAHMLVRCVYNIDFCVKHMHKQQDQHQENVIRRLAWLKRSMPGRWLLVASALVMVANLVLLPALAGIPCSVVVLGPVLIYVERDAIAAAIVHAVSAFSRQRR